MFVLGEMIFEGVCLEMSGAQTQLPGLVVLPIGKGTKQQCTRPGGIAAW